MRKGLLSEKDHNNFDAFLKRVLEAYKNDQIDRSSAIGSIMHVVAAVDKGETSQIKSWLDTKNAEFIFDGE